MKQKMEEKFYETIHDFMNNLVAGRKEDCEALFAAKPNLRLNPTDCGVQRAVELLVDDFGGQEEFGYDEMDLPCDVAGNKAIRTVTMFRSANGENKGKFLIEFAVECEEIGGNVEAKIIALKVIEIA